MGTRRRQRGMGDSCRHHIRARIRPMWWPSPGYRDGTGPNLL